MRQMATATMYETVVADISVMASSHVVGKA